MPKVLQPECSWLAATCPTGHVPSQSPEMYAPGNRAHGVLLPELVTSGAVGAQSVGLLEQTGLTGLWGVVYAALSITVGICFIPSSCLTHELMPSRRHGTRMQAPSCFPRIDATRVMRPSPSFYDWHAGRQYGCRMVGVLKSSIRVGEPHPFGFSERMKCFDFGGPLRDELRSSCAGCAGCT